MIYKPEELNLVQIEKADKQTVIVIQLKDGSEKIFEIEEG
jgi:hypothetical protein